MIKSEPYFLVRPSFFPFFPFKMSSVLSVPLSALLPPIAPLLPTLSTGPMEGPSPQQMTAATNIHRNFLLKKLRYAILMAKCQSGKTGAYHALIKMMLDAGDIQRVYILCGSTEIVLRNQFKKDARKHNPSYFRNDNTGTIQIYFHQDFKSASLNLTNALVIVDESHLVQTKGMGIHKFLGIHGITMDGNPTNLEAKNTYVLSVDATPYSEIAALVRKETPFEKHIEQLQPGDNYIGLETYSIHGKLQPTFDITHRRAEFTHLLEMNEGKYILMRFTNGKKATANENVVREICAAKGYKFLLYTAEKTEIAISREEFDSDGIPASTPCLEDAPAVTTVVIIRGRLRAGKVVPKKYIGFVWEGAKNSKTCSLVQGLPGRMCGYDFGQTEGILYTGELPMLFVPAPALNKAKGKVIEDSEMERAMSIHNPVTVLPRHATNLKKGSVATAPCDGKTACVPIRIEWDGRQLEDLLGGSFNHLKKEARELLQRNSDRISSSEHYTPDQKAEILANLASPTVPLHGRLMDGTSSDSAVSFFKNILEGHRAGTAQSELVSDCPEITYIITAPAFLTGRSIPGTNHRHVYVLFYTKAKGLEDRSDIHGTSRIANTNGRSIFSLDHSTFAAPVAAVGGVGIAVSSIRTPETFESSLRDYLTLWKNPGELVVQRCIQSVDGRFNLSKRHFHWSSKINDAELICRRLAPEFGIRKIAIKYARSGADMFNIKSISW